MKSRPFGAVDQADRVGRVAGSGNNFEHAAAAEIDFEAVVHEQGNVPGLGAYVLASKFFGRLAANHVRARVPLARLHASPWRLRA